MFDISNNNLMTMNRGDDVFFRINIRANDFGDVYEIGEKDSVFVGVMESRGSFENALIRKEFTKADMDDEGNIVATFKSDDTVNLIPGKYFIQAKLRSVVGESESGEPSYEISTILPKTRLIILD